jgi:hypothetical protein
MSFSVRIDEDRLDQHGLLLAPPPVPDDVEIAVGADTGAVGPVDVDGDAGLRPRGLTIRQ